MAYRITDECVCCGSCEPECPNQAISEGETICIIDPERCTECIGVHEYPQCSTTCAVDAPEPDPDHRESREQLLAKWQKLHPGETPAYA